MPEGGKMSDYGIDVALRAFNRKERYWLLRNAIGKKFEELDRGFLDRLQAALAERGAQVAIPSTAWFAFDYHFDWMYGAVARFAGTEGETNGRRSRRILAENAHQIAHDVLGNQEDMDLLIAFDRTIILIEAKFESSWGNTQYARKIARLKDLALFASETVPDAAENPLKFYFVLTSSREPQKLMADSEFGILPWVELICDEKTFSRVERCNEAGKASKEGKYWQIINRALVGAG